MKDQDPSGEIVTVRRLEIARESYGLLKERLLDTIKELQSEAPLKERATALKTLAADFQKVLTQVTDLEMDLEKRSSAIRGMASGGVLDFDAARAEILARIARIRERGGG